MPQTHCVSWRFPWCNVSTERRNQDADALQEQRVDATGWMKRAKQKLGRQGEQIAAVYLQRLGYVIIEHNWHCPLGEVDIVARDGECWVFVEVRTWRPGLYGTPEASITPRKQVKMLDVAQSYLQSAGLDDVEWRIDVVAIEMDSTAQVKRLNHIRSAVEAR